MTTGHFDNIFILFVNFLLRCGYATIHNVQDKSLEDRMESFFLSETCKYLYLVSVHSSFLSALVRVSESLA